MKPFLYSKNETDFTTNGIGALDFIKCLVTEERNGIFELEGEITSQAYHTSEIEMDSIIKAKVPDQSDLQLFRVYQIKKTIKDRYVIYAQHISYELSFIPSMPFSVSASSSACNDSLQALKSNAAQTCNFDFSTDITTEESFEIAVPTSIRNALGSTSSTSILSTFGGELKFDNFDVYLLSNRGKTAAQKDVNLIYGKDIIDLTQEENISNVITGVAPYWKDTDGNLVTLPEKVVLSSYAANYPFARITPLDCSMQFSSQPSQSELRSYAESYINNVNLGVPEVSIKVKFVDLAGEDSNNLKRLKLCDNVGVLFVKLGINTIAKVVKIIYDVLKEEYEEITIGQQSATLSSTIVDMSSTITSNAAKTVEELTSATSWITGSNGNIVAVRGTGGVWKDLLIMDTASIASAENIIKLNADGISVSNDGVDGTFMTLLSIDGLLTTENATIKNSNLTNIDGSLYMQIDDLSVTGGTYSGSTYTEINEINLNEIITYDSDDYYSLSIKAAQGLYIEAPEAFISDDSGVTINKLFTGQRDGYTYINGLMID